MSVDKLVDSAQLDADLASVASAIRSKGGTSAQLAFPAGFVAAVNAIPTGGGGMNIQAYHGMDYKTATSLTATAVKLKIAKAGTYKVSWMGFRNNSSNTFSSRLYVNGTAAGSDHTTFTRTYGQYCEETLTLAANDEICVYARARSTTYYMYVGNLIAEQTA